MGLWTEVGLGSMGTTRFWDDGFSKAVEDFLGALKSFLHWSSSGAFQVQRAGGKEGAGWVFGGDDAQWFPSATEPS